MLVQVIVSIVSVYIISWLIQYGLQYRKWLQLTSKINPIGKIHPIWGHFALVSVGCRCQFIVQAIIFLNVKASAVLLFVGIMYVYTSMQ